MSINRDFEDALKFLENKKIYNDKKLLCVDRACYYAKIENDIMKLTIRDCKSSIQFHNDLSDAEQVKEAFNKLEMLIKGATGLQDFIFQNYIQKPIK